MSNFYSIENDQIYLEISSFGAEWTRILAFDKKAECLWSGKKDIWPRHAPVLFPFIGKLVDGQYHFDEKMYAMTPHGFARDSEFTLEDKSSDSITFSLKTSKYSFEIYPFLFSLEITYSIRGNELISEYRMTNLDQKSLPYSIGAHAAFSYDWFSDGISWRSAFVKFQNEESDFFLLNGMGLVDPSLSSPKKIKNKKAEISEDMFSQDALIVRNPRSKFVEMCDGARRKIRVVFDTAFAFGLWSKSVGEFLCLEPWWGFPDVVGHNLDLNTKPGVIWLGPGESKTISWKTQFLKGGHE